jgi:hypothetical protein
MSRIRRPLLLALLVFTLSPAVQAHATPVVIGPVPLTFEVTQRDAGDTTSDAIANALNMIAEEYPDCVIVSYTAVPGLCTPEPFGNKEICSAEVTAQLRRKIVPLYP